MEQDFRRLLVRFVAPSLSAKFRRYCGCVEEVRDEHTDGVCAVDVSHSMFIFQPPRTTLTSTKTAPSNRSNVTNTPAPLFEDDRVYAGSCAKYIQ